MELSGTDARRRFANARVARLATTGADGSPHLVPVTFAAAGDLVYTAVDHKPKRTRNLRRLRNIAENPNVALLVDHYADDWAALWWVRADGTAQVVERAPDAIRLLSERYPQYQATPPEGPFIVISVRRWTGWSASPQ
ncbi:MAG: TIGR03668 family PPOX class F420-dependent oxidoreductase [Streptosporangiaceae bacterium]